MLHRGPQLIESQPTLQPLVTTLSLALNPDTGILSVDLQSWSGSYAEDLVLPSW